MSTVRFGTFSALLASAILVTGCGAADDASDGTETADSLTANAVDVEANPENPARRAELARVIAANVDAETAGAAHSTVSTTSDLDQDGIADALEEDLLRRYRPYYKFSVSGEKQEDNRPADPVTEITHSQLKQFTGDDGTTDPIKGCGRAGDAHLDPAVSLLTCRPDTSFLAAKAKKTYCLNIDNTRYSGVSFDEAKSKATGLVGHVANDTVNGHPAYKIEYWQFFAFNNQDITVLGLGSFGDHEGDWTSVQLWFDRTAQKVTKVEYLIHGKNIVFDIPAGPAPNCKSCFIDVKGPHYNPNLGNFFDDAERVKYQDNQAEFFIDANGYRHPVVYIERGAHEFWPGAWGHAHIDAKIETLHLNPHNGQGVAYLVPDQMVRPFNLGEVTHPLTSDARIILQYDAYWGCTNSHDLFGYGPQRRSPIGPAIHCEWKWPSGGPVAACEH